MSFAMFLILVQTLVSTSQSFWPGAALLLTKEEHTAFSKRYWKIDGKTTLIKCPENTVSLIYEKWLDFNSTEGFSQTYYVCNIYTVKTWVTFLSFSVFLVKSSVLSTSTKSSCLMTTDCSWLPSVCGTPKSMEATKASFSSLSSSSKSSSSSECTWCGN